ncbi:SNX17 [Cordylochernes scorpioides]|uniref:SNX17 n=1 Tax=Cordylochernes scorpioides TaxID=51811 RepID=A0ABY6LB64_9ARAC|nr:SNX17 [Cordylochernes scorpioides]
MSLDAYNIHINGAFHCTVRYKQLHSFHEQVGSQMFMLNLCRNTVTPCCCAQLKKEYGQTSLPTFPPKKLLSLTPAQTEERRSQLEKYIQLVSQDVHIATGEIFNGFFLRAQQESLNVQEQPTEVDLYLLNWQRVRVSLLNTAPTSAVLKLVAQNLNLPAQYHGYFDIFLVRKYDASHITGLIVGVAVVRWLQDFESPCLTLQAAGPSKYCLVLRKSYWDMGYDTEVSRDPAGLHLLYVQAVAEVEWGWLRAGPDSRQQLDSLQARGAKKEYLQLARSLQFYGYLHFPPCICDFPHPDTPAIVAVGGRELHLRVKTKAGPSEYSFRVTRIRCWRITTSIADKPPSDGGGTVFNSSGDCLRLELSFEYLMAKDKLQWINLVSDQAILMSVCLQGMVDELLLDKSGPPSRAPPAVLGPRRASWSYMRRDGTSHQISRSVSTDTFVNGNSRLVVKEDSPRVSHQTDKTLAEKLSSLSVKSLRNGHPPKSTMENYAFEGIGDDDL